MNSPLSVSLQPSNYQHVGHCELKLIPPCDGVAVAPTPITVGRVCSWLHLHLITSPTLSIINVLRRISFITPSCYSLNVAGQSLSVPQLIAKLILMTGWGSLHDDKPASSLTSFSSGGLLTIARLIILAACIFYVLKAI